MKITRHKILSVFLSVCMIISCMVGISVTASAESPLTTITATGKEQASYSTANVATVSFSYTAGGSSAYLANWGWWGYGWTATVTPAEGYTITKCIFYDDANRTATDSEAPFVVETTEEDKTPRINGTPIDGGNMQSKGITKIEVYGYTASAHDHSFTYSVNGATITATCSVAECPLTGSKATLTLVKPTLTTYGGTGDATATLTGLDAFNAATGLNVGATDIKYYEAEEIIPGYKRAGDELAQAPTGVGDYFVGLTLSNVKISESETEDVKVYVPYTIAKGAPTITIPPTASAITYGQTLADSTLSGGAASVPGTFSWKTPTTAPSVSDSDTTEYAVVFTPTDSTNYSAVETTVKVTVNKADPTAPTGLTAKTGQTLANVTLPTGWSWVDNTTDVGAVGNNTFSAKYTDTTGNYNDKTNVELTVTVSSSVTYTRVAAKAATCTATGNKEYYKGSDSKLYTKSDDTYTETTLAAVTIAKTAHTLTAVAAVDAKCTTDGTKAHYKCSECEKLFEDADGKNETTADALKVAKLGHNYVGGTCTRCGATDPNYGGNSGGYTPVIPSGGTTTTTTTTNTGSFADKTEENNNYSGAEINMKSDELEKAVLTDEDKKVIDAGGTVTVELAVEEMTPTAEEKKEIETAVEAAKEASGEDYTVAMYFDANLFKTSNGTKTQLHETNGKIAVSFKLPEQFKNTDSSVTRTYAVARIHDGKTEILVCEYDPETDLLTFYTDKFSTYALMYEDTAVETADVSAAGDKTLTATVSRTGNVKLSWSVQTGAQSYSVYQAKDGKWVKLGTTSKTTYTVKNLTNNKTYKFMLRAKVNGKLVAKADAMTLKVKVYFKPAIKLTAKKGSITIKWNKVPEATKYRVYKYVNGSLKLITATTKNAVRITGTKAGTKYSYAVKAYIDGKWTKVSKSDIASVTAK